MIRVSMRCGCAPQPQDMRTGADRLLAVVVNMVGCAQAHHGYLFDYARATRVKPLVHDGLGVWCATRRGIRAASWGQRPCGRRCGSTAVDGAAASAVPATGPAARPFTPANTSPIPPSRPIHKNPEE